MSEAAVVKDLAVGSEITGRTLVVTMERIQWYGDGTLSAAAGEPVRLGSNIHTDAEYARSQGLPGVIADGVMSANWLSSMLLQHFGRHYVERGDLRAKFIRPIFPDVVVTCRGRVRSVEDLGQGSTEYKLDVWCEDGNGTLLTVGDASVDVPNRQP